MTSEELHHPVDELASGSSAPRSSLISLKAAEEIAALDLQVARHDFWEMSMRHKRC